MSVTKCILSCLPTYHFIDSNIESDERLLVRCENDGCRREGGFTSSADPDQSGQVQCIKNPDRHIQSSVDPPHARRHNLLCFFMPIPPSRSPNDPPRRSASATGCFSRSASRLAAPSIENDASSGSKGAGFAFGGAGSAALGGGQDSLGDSPAGRKGCVRGPDSRSRREAAPSFERTGLNEPSPTAVAG
jgi:hypothetical protein